MTRPWRRTWTLRERTLLGLLLLVTVWAYRLVLIDIWTIGIGREEQSHVLLAPLVAGWLFWLRRSRLRSLRVRRSLWGPVMVAFGAGLSWLGVAYDIQILWHASAIVTLIGCVVSITGLAFLRQFAPAFLALFFLIPVPASLLQAVAIPLQASATSITLGVLETMGIPAAREGIILLVNGEQIAVGEACNGMRMVFALGLIVYAFAFSRRLRLPVTVMLLALSPLTALFCNIIRLIPTSLIFGYGSGEFATFFHDVSGWIMLPVALFMLIGVLRFLRWVELPVMSYRLTMS